MLDMPHWEDYELKEMGHTLRTEIANAILMRDGWEDRLEHLDLVRIAYSNNFITEEDEEL